MNNAIALLIGWVLDLFAGDPARLPHPVVWFGKAIAACEHRLNKGRRRMLKGALTSVTLVLTTFAATYFLRQQLCLVSDLLCMVVDAILIFYCLAGTTLIREVRQVFSSDRLNLTQLSPGTPEKPDHRLSACLRKL